MRTRLLATLVLITLTASMAGAQQPRGEADWSSAAAALGVGALVNVRTTKGERITGTLVGYSADGIRLQPRTRVPVASRDLAYGDIETLERARQPRMSPGVKVVLGVGIGAAVVLLTTALVFAAAAY